MFSIDSRRDDFESFSYLMFIGLGSLIIWLIEAVAVLTVMGGAARNFVRHLLFGESITFRETYKNVKNRVFGLIAASTMIAFLLGFIGLFIFYFGLFFAVLAVFIAAAALSFSPFLTVIVSIFLSLGIMFLAGWLFFLIASRFLYVPQVMMVEGQGVFASISRSASLAGGNVKRLAALFVFTTVAIYSALLLFLIPLQLYGYFSGISFLAADPDAIPAWYQIANQIIGQFSFIFLMPILMIGLCLLYVDERVRREGYDIELMAKRVLGDIPDVPSSFSNPLQPALANTVLPVPPSRNSSSPLGLN
jgi:hypothetical protein